MASVQNAVNNHEYRSVPITALAESATNPRKRFDAKKDDCCSFYYPCRQTRSTCYAPCHKLFR